MWVASSEIGLRLQAKAGTGRRSIHQLPVTRTYASPLSPIRQVERCPVANKSTSFCPELSSSGQSRIFVGLWHFMFMISNIPSVSWSWRMDKSKVKYGVLTSELRQAFDATAAFREMRR